jgi:hypothetical protein
MSEIINFREHYNFGRWGIVRNIINNKNGSTCQMVKLKYSARYNN